MNKFLFQQVKEGPNLPLQSSNGRWKQVTKETFDIFNSSTMSIIFRNQIGVVYLLKKRNRFGMSSSLSLTQAKKATLASAQRGSFKVSKAH